MMPLRNDARRFGLVSVVLHWGVALTVFGLFGVGLWMVGLDYYSPWYQQAPFLHKSVGVVLFAVMLLRLVWRWISPPPPALATHARWERIGAHLGHLALYLLVFAILISGYLISTADGRPVSVFGLFEVPATLSGLDRQEDIAGAVHYWLAWTLIALVVVHAAAALKHHFIDRDVTLLRMLGRSAERD